MKQKKGRAIAAAGIMNANTVGLGIGIGEAAQEFSHIGPLGIINSHCLRHKRD